MKLKLFTILFCLIGFSCKSDLKSEQDKIEVIASFDGKNYSKKYFDSITASQVYELKINTIKEEIINFLIKEEAKKNSMSSYDLIKEFSSSKADSLIQIELKRNNYDQIVNIDSSQARGIYKTAEYQVKKTMLGKNLIKKKNIEVFLEKEFHKSFLGELSSSYLLSPSNDEDKEVVIISNYECPHCYSFHKKLMRLIRKSNFDLNFKFVYFSDRILKFANAPIAAGVQNKFNEMNDFVFEMVQDGTISDSIIFEFASELNLDIEKFKRDYFSADTYNVLDGNRKIIMSNNIYSTPTLIINNKIYDEPNILDILKRKIHEEE
ncbi:MAG: thioredoxin domain-containing protein [Brumimicrobium sp.]